MRNIEFSFKKVRGQIMDLLIEIWPGQAEAIKFAHDDNFKEWAAMLFKLDMWQMKPHVFDLDTLEMSQTTTEAAMAELESYEGLTDYKYITGVEIADDIHLLDGYHRVLLAKKRRVNSIPGVLWYKEENTHPNCAKVKRLILDNL